MRPQALLLVLLGLTAHSLALAQSGALDPSFGDGGIVIVEDARIQAVVEQADGSLIAVGEALTYHSFFVSSDAAAWRFSTDGTPDVTFGDSGASVWRLPVESGLEESYFTDFTVRPSGSIVAVGAATCCSEHWVESSTVQLLPDGTLDPEFGTNGHILGHAPGTLRDVRVHPDAGTIAAGVASGFYSSGLCYAVRFHPDGTLDESFGEEGLVAFTPELPTEQYVRCNDAAIDWEGRVVFVATAETAGDAGLMGSNVIAIRLSTDGTLDPTFGTEGVAVIDLQHLHKATSVAVSPGGGITVGGVVTNEHWTPTSHLLARLSPDGEPDPTFGSDGIAEVDIELGNGYISGLVAEDGGAIIVSAWEYVFRVRPDGLVDPMFGADGVVTVADGSVRTVITDAEGRVVLAGSSYDAATEATNGLIARLLNDGTVASEPSAQPGRLLLAAPAPNPAAGVTKVTFTLTDPASVRLAVYDVLGREVAVLAEGTHSAGPHTATLDASLLTSGLYVAHLTAGGEVATRRLTVVR